MLALRPRLLAGQVHISKIYRDQSHFASIAIFDKVQSHTAAYKRSFCEVLLIEVPVSDFDRMVTVQNSTIAAVRAFYRAKPAASSSAAKRL